MAGSDGARRSAGGVDAAAELQLLILSSSSPLPPPSSLSFGANVRNVLRVLKRPPATCCSHRRARGLEPLQTNENNDSKLLFRQLSLWLTQADCCARHQPTVAPAAPLSPAPGVCALLRPAPRTVSQPAGRPAGLSNNRSPGRLLGPGEPANKGLLGPRPSLASAWPSSASV